MNQQDTSNQVAIGIIKAVVAIGTVVTVVWVLHQASQYQIPEMRDANQTQQWADSQRREMWRAIDKRHGNP